MIVTRFAPSPTGYLHIGGARTALFNYLYARHHGGKFLLRVEDTDADRNNPDAAAAILSGLKWLGIDWDDEPVYQSTRTDRHREVAAMLVASGHAYRDYTTRFEEEHIRATWAISNPKRPFVYRSTERDSDTDRIDPYVIRFKTPEANTELVVEDAVQGSVKVQSRIIEDFVLLRSDGSPTFLLACTVDDHDMGVTDVVRGDDHLNNAFKQNLISNALGWNPPRYAHVPLIHNAEGKKLSKRDGAAAVGDYEGDYLPDAVVNYLMRLGWGHGNDEIISREQAIEWFDVKDIGRNPARLDAKKLLNVNAHYVNALDPCSVSVLTDVRHRNIVAVAREVQKRSKTLSDLRGMMAFLVERPSVEVDPRAREIADLLLTDEGLEDAIRGYCDDNGLKLGEVAGIIRFALTGMKNHIGIFEMIRALGIEESVERLRA